MPRQSISLTEPNDEWVTDRIDSITQRAALEVQPAEHIEHPAAQRVAGLLQLVEQLAVDIAFAGLVGHQVPQMADLGLARWIRPKRCSSRFGFQGRS